MGKRKSSKKVEKKAGPAPLDKTFRCLFCQHPGTIVCKMDKKERMGRLDCKVCAATYSMPINHLSQPIDIYSEWIDASENVNVPEASRTEAGNTRQVSRPARGGSADSDIDLSVPHDGDSEEEVGDAQRSRNGKQPAPRRSAVEDEEDDDLPEV